MRLAIGKTDRLGRRIVMFSVAVVMSHQLGTMAGGQVGPPPDGAWLNYECEKTLVCSGAPSGGYCTEFMLFCLDGTCSAQAGCSYEYLWNCVAAEKVCLHSSEQEIHSPDCGPRCVWSEWNECYCWCREMGSGTVESGTYWQCFTKDSIPQ